MTSFWFSMLVIFLGLFILWFVAVASISRSSRQFVEAFDLSRHILITWLIVPFIRLYFWFLERLGKIRVNINGTIPWEEGFILAPNHPMEKLQDTFLLPVLIYFLRPKNLANPIRYFPVSASDHVNFADSFFFKIAGPKYLISIKRNNGFSIQQAQKTIEEAKNQYSQILLLNPEYGRTLRAIVDKRYREMETPSGKLYLGRLKLGVAELSLQTGKPIIPVWSTLLGDDSYSKVFKDHYVPPKASPEMVFKGLAELLFDRKKKVYIEIGHPQGPIKTESEETSEQLTERLERLLFEIGILQLKRLSKK